MLPQTHCEGQVRLCEPLRVESGTRAAVAIYAKDPDRASSLGESRDGAHPPSVSCPVVHDLSRLWTSPRGNWIVASMTRRRQLFPQVAYGSGVNCDVVAPIDGLYLNFAVICEKVLREADDVLSFIRIVDQLTVTIMTPPGADAAPELPSAPLAALTFVIGLKSCRTGTFTLNVDRRAGARLLGRKSPLS